jgi:hypothetical protein
MSYATKPHNIPDDSREGYNERLDRKWLEYRLESRYHDRCHAYFGGILRCVRPVDFYDIEETLEANLNGEEYTEMTQLDLIVRGRPRTRPDLEEFLLAVEIAVTVDRADVERAHRCAALLRRAGYLAVAAVAGEQQTEGADEAARAIGVVMLQNGTVQYWDEAIKTALP